MKRCRDSSRAGVRDEGYASRTPNGDWRPGGSPLQWRTRSAEIEQIIEEAAPLARPLRVPLVSLAVIVASVMVAMARIAVVGRFRAGEPFEFAPVEEDAATL